LPVDTSQLKPGTRIAVGLSGGVDSVALLRILAQRNSELGLVLHVAHLHHGLRGAEADADFDFCRDLARSLDLRFHEARVDTASAALKNFETGKPVETIEEAARRLRYGWFRELMASGTVEAVATAHNRDDQAETVLAKLLRGAWTEGLSGIHPVVTYPEGRIVRPLLATSRTDIQAYLSRLGQAWREDSTNLHLAFTRNRIRHELLPQLEPWNPRLREHLAHLAELARDEEGWWTEELDRVAPQLLLPGRPVRGGGRAAAGGFALDIHRFAELAPALQRRLLRYAAEKLGAAPDFAATEALRNLALTGRAGQKIELAQGLRGERTYRELRLLAGSGRLAGAQPVPDSGQAFSGRRVVVPCVIEVPGEHVAAELGLRIIISVIPGKEAGASRDPSGSCKAVLRPWKAGDRVRLRHSSGPRKVKEVLERLHISGSSREDWPVLEYDGRIVWMRGVEVERESGVCVEASTIQASAPAGSA
jgi:tRNA(Ile)-lysidine synthase